MTKKDYQLIASVIYESVERWQDTQAMPIIREIADEFANQLAEENDRFDRTKFLLACGLINVS